MSSNNQSAPKIKYAQVGEVILERQVGFLPSKLERRRAQFIKVPWVWYEQLVKARYSSTYQIALYVLYLHWKRNGQPFALPNGGLKMLGISRWRKWRGLRELESLALVQIERRPRRAPLITVTTIS